MEYAIEIEKLHKEFHPVKRTTLKDIFCFSKNKSDSIIACNDVNLRIKKGELFGLVGPNGAGKTTLIKILATIIIPDRGEVKVSGFDLVKEDHLVRSCVGLVTSETKSFYGRLTGRENLYFFASLYNLFSEKKKKKVEELANLLGIADKLDIMFQQYSTGIKQRLAIARGLLNDAPILLVDEPTKSLDPLSAEELRKFIRNKLVKEIGKTVIFTSHSLSEIEMLADTIAIMHNGAIKAQGSFSSLKQNMGKVSCTIEEVFKHYVYG